MFKYHTDLDFVFLLGMHLQSISLYFIAVVDHVEAASTTSIIVDLMYAAVDIYVCSVDWSSGKFIYNSVTRLLTSVKSCLFCFQIYN